MPKPNPGETERDFLHRCIPELIDEGKPQKQAVAICYSIYRKHGTEEKSPKPEKMGSNLSHSTNSDLTGPKLANMYCYMCDY